MWRLFNSEKQVATLTECLDSEEHIRKQKFFTLLGSRLVKNPHSFPVLVKWRWKSQWMSITLTGGDGARQFFPLMAWFWMVYFPSCFTFIRRYSFLFVDCHRKFHFKCCIDFLSFIHNDILWETASCISHEKYSSIYVGASHMIFLKCWFYIALWYFQDMRQIRVKREVFMWILILHFYDFPLQRSGCYIFGRLSVGLSVCLSVCFSVHRKHRSIGMWVLW